MNSISTSHELIVLKICSIERGINPFRFFLKMSPNIEYVLPEPVYPYANIVPLYPFITSLMVSCPTAS